MNNHPIIIIGGNAAGMSAASRARRNDPEAEIIVFEKTGDVSYGACGLPYFISDDIKEAQALIAVSVEKFREERRIDVHLYSEVVGFDPKSRQAEVRNLKSGQNEKHQYSKLIIAGGARSVIPPIPGRDLKNVFVLRTLADGIKIKEKIAQENYRHAVIVGGGYIGLEMAEAFKKCNIDVTIVEMLDQVMPNIDPDMADLVEEELTDNGCRVIKSNGVKEIRGKDRAENVLLNNGDSIDTDLILLSVGIKPDIEFAVDAGVCTGQSGAIETDNRMRTNIIDVYAAGDCAEVKNLVTGKNDYIPLGTTANKQGKVAGDNATGGTAKFNGIVGTAVVKVFDLEVARTGMTEAEANKRKQAVKSVVIKSISRAGYYPDPQRITVKLIFEVQEGRLLGAQIAGKEGVAKRIDILATALHQKMTVQEISDLDLSYAPPFAPVWDPVLIAANQAVKKVRK